MCGIHGFINGVTAETNADDFIKSGCVAGMLRGMDSTGVVTVATNKSDLTLRKLPLPGNYFIDDKQFVKMLPTIRSSNVITIAHTRAATHGKVTEGNAHPFLLRTANKKRRIVGVHNGTLSGWQHKAKDRFDVDSQWALATILEKGMDAFKEFTGAYCFVWWDSENPGELKIARNDQRPMHVAFTKKGGLAYASESGMLDWLLERHRIEVDGDIRALRPDKVYTFDIADVKGITIEDLPKAPVSSSAWNSNNYYRQSCVQEVDALLTRILKKEKEEASKAATPAEEVEEGQPELAQYPLAFNAKGERLPVVTKEETEDAKTLGVLGDKVPFHPSHTDERTNLLYGAVTLVEQGVPWECDAIMRSASGVSWKKGEALQVTVLGAVLSQSDSLIVVSKPRINLASVASSAAVH